MTTVIKPAMGQRAAEWSDPEFFADRLGRSTNFWRLLWFLLLPPDTQRTVATPAGGVLIVVSLGIGVAAYNNANNVLFIALSLMLSSLVLSGMLSWVNFRGVTWRLVLPPHFRAGEPVSLHLELVNAKRIAPTYSLLFRVRARQENATQPLYFNDRLDPNGRAGLDWLFTPKQRGRETIEIAGVESQFPFGFLRKTAGGGVRHEVLVWPARVPYEFAPPLSQRAHFSGEAQRRPGPGADLLGLRTYRPGDAPRLMHWKASARLGHLVVRQTGEEQRTGYYILVDTGKAIWAEAEQFERLCSLAASLAEDLFAEGKLLGFSINGEPVQQVKRLADLQALLDRLARLEPVAHSTAPALAGNNVITFKPGPRHQAYACLNGQLAGAA
jgi:uncharacterized protein (DUF58 family)